MSYIHLRTSYHIARRDYGCTAMAMLDYDLPYFTEQMSKEDLAILEAAAKEQCRIKKGTKYIYNVGVIDGDFHATRSRIDLDKLCAKYGAYDVDL